MREKNEYTGDYGRIWKSEHRKKMKEWWESLENDRGARARLRRCEVPLQIMMEPGFYRLMKSLESWPQSRIHGLAITAGILSHIRTDITHNIKGSEKYYIRFGRQLSETKKDSEKPPLSELRFLQLQKCRTPEELYRHLRRIVQLLDKTANVLSVADFILAWDLEHSGYTVKDPSKRLQFLLARDYFSTL